MREQRNGESRKRVDERVWKGSQCVERSDGRDNFQGRGHEEEDKVLMACGEAEC